MPNHELTVIIPTLDEESALPLLLQDLAAQEIISFEVIVADGGSTDKTRQEADRFFTSGRLQGKSLCGPSGRGRQLNAGAAAAKGDWLLFLHADSRIYETTLLRRALDYMKQEYAARGGHQVAGRFALRFDAIAPEHRFAYYFYETKALLGRPGCIHGDQGMLLARSCYQDVGPFREDLPVMEDTSLAEDIRQIGSWLLLPGEILTSARRFEREGIKARQTLNALMMNFLAIGWFEFFQHAPEIYSQQRSAATLQLRPFYLSIDSLLKPLSLRRRLSIWLATGKYVRGQAWQLALLLDSRKNFRRGLPPSAQPGPWVQRCDRWFDPLTDHWPGYLVTAFLVRLWFAGQLWSGK